MSKITRAQIKMAIYGADLQNLEQATDAVMTVIDKQQAVYDELVKAVVEWKLAWDKEESYLPTGNRARAVFSAIQPFLLSPAEQIADELDALVSEAYQFAINEKIAKLAKRVRELK